MDKTQKQLLRIWRRHIDQIMKFFKIDEATAIKAEALMKKAHPTNLYSLNPYQFYDAAMSALDSINKKPTVWQKFECGNGSRFTSVTHDHSNEVCSFSGCNCNTHVKLIGTTRDYIEASNWLKGVTK